MGFRRDLGRTMRDYGLRVPVSLLREDEPFVRGVANRLTRKDTVLDIGAFRGMASTEFAQRAGRVFAYEPHPLLFAELLRNTRHYKRITAIDKAVATSTGTATFHLRPRSDGSPSDGSTLVGNKSNVDYDAVERVSVETVSLADAVRATGGPVRLVKMDVEGSEYEILSAFVESDAVTEVGLVYVEDHCDRVPGLADQRARVEARIAALGLQDRFDFGWP